jgi:hypothetical protein
MTCKSFANCGRGDRRDGGRKQGGSGGTEEPFRMGTPRTSVGMRRRADPIRPEKPPQASHSSAPLRGSCVYRLCLEVVTLTANRETKIETSKYMANNTFSLGGFCIVRRLLRVLMLVALAACSGRRTDASAVTPGPDPFANVDWIATLKQIPGASLSFRNTGFNRAAAVRLGTFSDTLNFESMSEGVVDGVQLAVVPWTVGSTAGSYGGMVFALRDHRVTLVGNFNVLRPGVQTEVFEFESNRLVLYEILPCSPCKDPLTDTKMQATPYSFDGQRLRAGTPFTATLRDLRADFKSRPAEVYLVWHAVNGPIYDENHGWYEPVYRSLTVTSARLEVTGFGITGIDKCGKVRTEHVDGADGPMPKPGTKLIFVTADLQNGQGPGDSIGHYYGSSDAAVPARCVEPFSNQPGGP